jgi:hypothetical protein
MTEAVPIFTLVTGDPFYRLQRAIGLIPRRGLGVGRRALLFAAVSWLPLVIWALVVRRALPGDVPEPLCQHFGIHVRCLVTIPLFLLAEPVVETVLARQLAYLVTSGVIPPAGCAGYERMLASCARLRDSWIAWTVIAMLAVISTMGLSAPGPHELSWAAAGGTAHGFGGHWAWFVGRPLFALLGLAWLWRLLLIGILFARLARLDLALVPTHPDRAGGLGLLEAVPVTASLLGFAVSALIASRLAHDVRYHGMTVAEFKVPAVALLIIVLLLLLSPLMPLTAVLARCRRRALHDYGALIGRHGRSVRARWIAGMGEVDADLLAAAELGPVIDTVSMGEVVIQMRPIPFGKRALIAIVLAVLLPLLPVVAMEVPLKEVLMKLLGALL